MKINKELLKELIYSDEGCAEFKVVENILTDTSRWSVHYDCVIKHLESGKFYDAAYSCGATESQDEEPFDHLCADEEGNVDLDELFPHKMTIVQYRTYE